ncbi:MAG: esterase/lipase family protein [Gammaproteobacteria bacterium]
MMSKEGPFDLAASAYVLFARLLLCFVVVSMSGCGATPKRPDLARLYAHQADDSAIVPVVLIHGTLGARLFNDEKDNEVWPGSLRRILFDDYEALELDISNSSELFVPSQLRSGGITDGAAGKDFYGRILSVLENAGGYIPTTVGTPSEGNRRRLYVFDYDWRQDNVYTVRQLHDFIEQIRLDHNAPELKVDIVAHSMGGLITRYYARYGTTDVLNDNDFPVTMEGASRLRRVLLLGTPNFGSVLAVDILDKGKRVGFGTVPPEVVATFPSAYQVLPHALNTWLLNVDGKPNSDDVFDVEFWRDHKLSIFHPEVRKRLEERSSSVEEGRARFAQFERFFEQNLERARRFTWSLTVTLEDTPIRFGVFGGDCALTPARMVLEEVNSHHYLRLHPKDILHKRSPVDYERLMLEPGDGTVSKASLLARQSSDPTIARHKYSFFPLGYAFFLCEDHQSLTGNISFQDNLLNALLSADQN